MDEKVNANIQFLTAKQLAGFLALSPRTVWRLRSAGKLPKPVQIGGAVRWRLSDVEKHFENKGAGK